MSAVAQAVASDDILVRPLEERDVAFVVDTWVASFRRAHYSGVLPKHVYAETHARHFHRVVTERPGVHVLIAVNPVEDDPRFEIYGALVHETGYRVPIVHWAYTKFGMRRFGVAQTLLRAAFIDPRLPFVASCWTHDATVIRDAWRTKHRFLQAKHDPRFLRDPTWKDREKR